MLIINFINLNKKIIYFIDYYQLLKYLIFLF